MTNDYTPKVNTPKDYQYKQPLKLKWVPKKDITAFELAILLTHLVPGGTPMFQEDFDALGKMNRHLEIIE